MLLTIVSGNSLFSFILILNIMLTLRYPKSKHSFLVFFSLLSLSLQAQETLSFTVLNGTEIRCYPDSVVQIEISPNSDFNFSVIAVDWGDGTNELIQPGESLTLEHEFPIAQFLEECSYETCGTQGGFCFQVTIDAAYGGATPEENISKRITFKFPPRPAFTPDIGYICPGTAFALNNFTCPDNDPTMTYSWAFPDGSTSTEAEPTYEFDTPGTYPISLTASNECDTVSTTLDITVNELPTANITPDLGFEEINGDSLLVCLTDGGNVSLTSEGSSNVTSYEWTFSPNNGFNLVDEIFNDSMSLQFTSDINTFYEIMLTVDNPCMVPSTATTIVEVVPALVLNLMPQADSCLTMTYAPSPLLPDIRYNLNGTIYESDDFPITLVENTEPYILEAIAFSRCDTAILRDTFFVFGEFDPAITLPAEDLTVCRDTNLLLLETNGQGMNWSVDQGDPLIEQDGQVFFNQDQEDGAYVVTFSQGFGACEGIATRTITIQSPDVSLDGPWSVCEEGSPIQLTATQEGGTWGGEGITGMDGTFSPENLMPGTTYDVFYTFDDSGNTGCTTTVSSSVAVVALPTISDLPDQLSVCQVDDILPLPDLTGVSFSPDDGAVMWSGTGVIDEASGDYNPIAVSTDTDTVTLQYEISPGCAVEDTIILSIDSLTLAVAEEDFVFCDSEPVLQLSAEPPGQGSWSGAGVDPQTGIVDLSQVTAGQTYPYVYTVNEAIASCLNQDTVNVTIANGEGVSLPFNEVYICDTATFLVLPTGTPSTGEWMGMGVSGDTLFLNGVQPDTFALSFSVEDLPEACNSTDLEVFFSPRPSVEILSDSTACEDTDCLQFAVNAQSSAEAFEWDFGDGNTNNDESPCHIYTETGLYTVSLTSFLVNPITNQRYCASLPGNTEVDILGALPAISTLPSSTSECPDFLVSLAPSEVDDRFTYSWSVHNIADSTATTLEEVLLPATTEDTTYIATLTTSNGCDTQTDSLELIARAPFQAGVGTDFDTPCSGETVSFYNLSTGTASSPTEWLFSNGQTYTGTEPPPFQVFTDTLPSVLGVTIIGSNACNSDTATYEIEIQPTDVRARMNYSAETLCAGASLELTNISTPGAPISWVTSDGSSYLSQSVSHIFSEPNDSAWVTIYAEGCGFDSLRYYFEVQPRPELGLEFDPIGCANEPLPFSVTGNAEEQTLFYGTGDSTLLSNSEYLYSAPGSYPITVFGRSLEGCQDSISATIEIAPLPIPLIAPVDSVCAGEVFALSSQSTGASSCLWKMADGGTRDQCTSNYSFATPGLKSNILVVTSNAGCMDSLAFPVFVRPTPIAQFDYTGSGECSPAFIQFNSIDEPFLPDNWVWNFGDGSSSDLPAPGHTYDFGGTYDVSLLVSIGGICFDSIQQSIYVPGTPRFDTLTIDERCLPSDAFVLEVATDSSNEITVAGENYFQAGINRFEIIEPGNYTLDVLSQDGCDTTLQFRVPPVFPLQVTLMPDTAILFGQSVRIVSQVNASNLDFEWSPTDYLEDTITLQPLATPHETTTYVLSVNNELCEASDTITITVDEEIRVYFPNAFSPNGDGVNDRYRFFPVLGIDEVLSFQIFDRWGELVYYFKTDPSAAFEAGQVTTWDGTLDGKDMNPGVFTYKARLKLVNEEEKLFVGDLHLVR